MDSSFSSSLSKRAHSTDGCAISPVGGPSHGCKRYKSSPSSLDGLRKVSFGRLQETVFFDKADSSNKLSLGVSVSDSSLGTSYSGHSNHSSFRWEAHQSPSATGNANWGNIPSPQESRWHSAVPTPARPNMFLQMLNSSRPITPQNTQPIFPTRRASIDIEDQDMALEENAMQSPGNDFPQLPTRRSSLVAKECMPPPTNGLPLLPSRRASLIPQDASTTGAPMVNADFVVGAAPRRPVRSQSPVSFA